MLGHRGSWLPGEEGLLISPQEKVQNSSILAHGVKLSRNNQWLGQPAHGYVALISQWVYPALAEAKTYTYWAYLCTRATNPPLPTPVNWGEGSIPVYVSDSSWIPVPEDEHLPTHKEEEETPLNSTLGFDTWPICLGVGQGCFNLSTQAWLSVNSLNRNHTKVQLHLLSGLIFAYQETNKLIWPSQIDPCVRTAYGPTDKTKYAGIIVAGTEGVDLT